MPKETKQVTDYVSICPETSKFIVTVEMGQLVVCDPQQSDVEKVKNPRPPQPVPADQCLRMRKTGTCPKKIAPPEKVKPWSDENIYRR